MAARDSDLERELLAETEGLPSYAEQVLARLDHYEAEDGGDLDGYDLTLDQILAEAQEEAADISGWLIGAALQLHPVRRRRLIVAMRLAAVAHREIEELRLDLAAQLQEEPDVEVL